MTKSTKTTSGRKAKKTIIVPKSVAKEAAKRRNNAKPKSELQPAEFRKWLKTGLPAELNNMFGRIEPTRTITFAVPLVKLCGTYQRAGVLSRILYYAEHNPLPTHRLPKELRSRPGPWIRTSERQLHRQCCLARGTVGDVLKWLEKNELIETWQVRKRDRTYIHPRCDKLQEAIQRQRNLEL